MGFKRKGRSGNMGPAKQRKAPREGIEPSTCLSAKELLYPLSYRGKKGRHQHQPLLLLSGHYDRKCLFTDLLCVQTDAVLQCDECYETQYVAFRNGDCRLLWLHGPHLLPSGKICQVRAWHPGVGGLEMLVTLKTLAALGRPYFFSWPESASKSKSTTSSI